MIKIQINEDKQTYAIEMTADADMDRFYTASNFAVCGGHLGALLAELERLGLIPARPKTTEHQAQGLFNMEWSHSIETADGGCGS